MQITLRALALSLLTLPVAADEVWFADYDEAVKAARADGKHLLVDFTGSDWCHWCIRLDEEVFSHEEFEAGVKEDFVLVKLDFPNSPEIKAKVPNPERNQELAALHGVQGYPTVLLLTVDGEVFGRTGYRPDGPEPYVEYLGELLENGLAELNAIKQALAAYATAEGEQERAAKLDALLDLLAEQGPDSAFVGLLLGPAREAMTQGTDAQKRKGVDALVSAGAVDAEVLAAARGFDPKNEEGLWFDALSSLLSSIDSLEKVQLALAEMDAFTDAGLEVPESDAPDFYFLAAYWYDRFGSVVPEGLDEEATKAHKARDNARAKRYAKLARPLWDDPQRLQALDAILDD